jgi:hypothetical protein
MATLHPGWIDLVRWLEGLGMNSCLVEGRATPGAGYGLFAASDLAVRNFPHLIPNAE